MIRIWLTGLAQFLFIISGLWLLSAWIWSWMFAVATPFGAQGHLWFLAGMGCYMSLDFVMCSWKEGI